MFLICSCFFRYLSLNVLISMVLTQQIACIIYIAFLLIILLQLLKVDSDISFRGDSSTANGTASCPHDASYTGGTNEMSTPLR